MSRTNSPYSQAPLSPLPDYFFQELTSNDFTTLFDCDGATVSTPNSVQQPLAVAPAVQSAAHVAMPERCLPSQGTVPTQAQGGTLMVFESGLQPPRQSEAIPKETSDLARKRLAPQAPNVDAGVSFAPTNLISAPAAKKPKFHRAIAPKSLPESSVASDWFHQPAKPDAIWHSAPRACGYTDVTDSGARKMLENADGVVDTDSLHAMHQIMAHLASPIEPSHNVHVFSALLECNAKKRYQVAMGLNILFQAPAAASARVRAELARKVHVNSKHNAVATLRVMQRFNYIEDPIALAGIYTLMRNTHPEDRSRILKSIPNYLDPSQDRSGRSALAMLRICLKMLPADRLRFCNFLSRCHNIKTTAPQAYSVDVIDSAARIASAQRADFELAIAQLTDTTHCENFDALNAQNHASSFFEPLADIDCDMRGLIVRAVVNMHGETDTVQRMRGRYLSLIEFKNSAMLRLLRDVPRTAIAQEAYDKQRLALCDAFVRVAPELRSCALLHTYEILKGCQQHCLVECQLHILRALSAQNSQRLGLTATNIAEAQTLCKYVTHNAEPSLATAQAFSRCLDMPAAERLQLHRSVEVLIAASDVDDIVAERQRAQYFRALMFIKPVLRECAAQAAVLLFPKAVTADLYTHRLSLLDVLNIKRAQANAYSPHAIEQASLEIRAMMHAAADRSAVIASFERMLQASTQDDADIVNFASLLTEGITITSDIDRLRAQLKMIALEMGQPGREVFLGLLAPYAFGPEHNPNMTFAITRCLLYLARRNMVHPLGEQMAVWHNSYEFRSTPLLAQANQFHHLKEMVLQHKAWQQQQSAIAAQQADAQSMHRQQAPSAPHIVQHEFGTNTSPRALSHPAMSPPHASPHVMQSPQQVWQPQPSPLCQPPMQQAGSPQQAQPQVPQPWAYRSPQHKG